MSTKCKLIDSQQNSIIIKWFLNQWRASETAQRARALASNPDDLNSAPDSHMVGEDWLLQVVLWPPHDMIHKHMLMCAHTYRINFINVSLNFSKKSFHIYMLLFLLNTYYSCVHVHTWTVPLKDILAHLIFFYIYFILWSLKFKNRVVGVQLAFYVVLGSVSSSKIETKTGKKERNERGEREGLGDFNLNLADLKFGSKPSIA